MDQSAQRRSPRMLLLVYNLWSLFMRVFENQGGHTEALEPSGSHLLMRLMANIKVTREQQLTDGRFLAGERECGRSHHPA